MGTAEADIVLVPGRRVVTVKVLDIVMVVVNVLVMVITMVMVMEWMVRTIVRRSLPPRTSWHTA